MPLHPLQTEWDAELCAGDPLSFPGYAPPDEESVVTGRTDRYALIEGRFEVLGGSMGAAHGERVVRAYRRAADERLPVVVVTRSGGARMQEGMVSLVQMARTSAAAAEHARAGLLQVAVLRGPTTGGVYASYASLAHLRAAEPGALVGFAGPRVVELTTGERLPDTSHTAEAAWRAGLVDALVDREEQPAWVESALGQRDAPPRRPTPAPPVDVQHGPWGEVVTARSRGRWDGVDWAMALCDSWTPLHAPDPSIRAGLATIAGRRSVVVATRRARPGPPGFRLAQRAIALASSLRLPLVSFVDTPGADAGPESEAGGIAAEIARTFRAMAELSSVSVSICVGEGGSGGALALASTDRLLMLEHAVFSVIPPEGAAAILDRDIAAAPERAAHLKLTAGDLLGLGVVDEVLHEASTAVRKALLRAMDEARPGDRLRRFDAVTERWLR